MNSRVTYNHFRVTYDTDSVHSIGIQSSPCSVLTDISNLHQNRNIMELERIRKLEESVLLLQKETTLPKQKDLDSDVLTRLGNLEASVVQEKAQKGELKKKLKFANNQNSRLLLRLKKEKARTSLLNYRMRGAKLPNIPISDPLLQGDGRMSKSMNDIPQNSFGNQGRLDSSDSLSFTDEDSLPRVNSQFPQHRSKEEFSRDGRMEYSERSRLETGAQRIGARMSGEQALQLLPSYQQTIIQQQQEIRDLQLKIRSTEQTHSNLIKATLDGRELVEYLNVISEREKLIESLKQKSRELQIGLMELENEKNDAIDLAKDLSLQLTRAKLAKDAALRTSRQLMEQFPTRPPRDARESPENSLPSTPGQNDNSDPPVPRSAPPSVSGGDTKLSHSRYLPQPPPKHRTTAPKIIVNESTEIHSSPTIPSPSYDSASLPRSVQFFKKSVQSQKQSDMLPSKLLMKNKTPSRTPDSTGSKLLASVFSRNKRDPIPTSELSPQSQQLVMTSSVAAGKGTESHRSRSDSETDPSTPGAKSLDIIRESEVPISSMNSKHNDGVSGDSMGKRAISMSTLTAGLGIKGKQKDKSGKSKKVKSAEEQVKISGNNKVHKRFSSLNSLPNAFKRSPKLEERDKKRREIPRIPDSNKKEKRKGRLSDDGLEIEFKHISDNSTARVSDKFRLSLASLPISERSETVSPSEEFHSLVRSKKLGDINTLANLSTQSSPPWES